MVMVLQMLSLASRDRAKLFSYSLCWRFEGKLVLLQGQSLDKESQVLFWDTVCLQ